MTYAHANNRCAAVMIATILTVLAAALAAPAQVTTLLTFNGTNGDHPDGGLIQATDGSLYGTTSGGGVGTSCLGSGCGTIFRFVPGRVFATLYTFDFNTTGSGPAGPLVQDSAGNFYGTAVGGGSHSCQYGCGTVFKMTPKGIVTRLHSFDGADGDTPQAGVIVATDGNLYGTARYGGANNGGTVFKLDLTTGTLTTLYNFCSQTNCADGDNIWGGLVQGTDGNFYGTAAAGGANGDGTVFKITPEGTLTTLHSFDGADGLGPQAGLVQGQDGDFYGTTGAGGNTSCGCGTVFKISPEGTFTTLHSFGGADGSDPIASLAAGSDGNFYGTTFYGGVHCGYVLCGNGTVFQITPGGVLTTLSYVGVKDDQYPDTPLVQATNGTFYGTSDFGGAFAFGTIFSLSLGLGPF